MAAPEINSSTTVEFESNLWISDSSRKEVKYNGSKQENQGMEVEQDNFSGASPGMSYQESKGAPGMAYEENNGAPKCTSMIVIGAGARGKVCSWHI